MTTASSRKRKGMVWVVYRQSAVGEINVNSFCVEKKDPDRAELLARRLYANLVKRGHNARLAKEHYEYIYIAL